MLRSQLARCTQGEDSKSCGNSWCDLWDDPGGLSGCDLVTLAGVPVVTDVPVSPSSAVAEMCEGVPLDSGWEFVEPQSFSFSNQKAFDCLGGESRRHAL